MADRPRADSCRQPAASLLRSWEPGRLSERTSLRGYIRTAGIAGDEKSPLFRSAVRRTGTLAATAMHRVDAWRMIQRRAAELGMKVMIGCHTFRATGITAYLEAGGTLENAQAMAAHESPRTTKLYDDTKLARMRAKFIERPGQLQKPVFAERGLPDGRKSVSKTYYRTLGPFNSEVQRRDFWR
jgi:integrase